MTSHVRRSSVLLALILFIYGIPACASDFGSDSGAEVVHVPSFEVATGPDQPDMVGPLDAVR